MTDRILAHAAVIAGDICAAPGDQLAAVREVHLAIEAPVLRTGLVHAGWSQNAAARVLGCSLGAVRSALRRHPEIAAEARRLGPLAPAHKRRRGGDSAS